MARRRVRHAERLAEPRWEPLLSVDPLRVGGVSARSFDPVIGDRVVLLDDDAELLIGRVTA